jgi:hypothetical protein
VRPHDRKETNDGAMVATATAANAEPISESTIKSEYGGEYAGTSSTAPA